MPTEHFDILTAYVNITCNECSSKELFFCLLTSWAKYIPSGVDPLIITLVLIIHIHAYEVNGLVRNRWEYGEETQEVEVQETCHIGFVKLVSTTFQANWRNEIFTKDRGHARGVGQGSPNFGLYGNCFSFSNTKLYWGTPLALCRDGADSGFWWNRISF